MGKLDPIPSGLSSVVSDIDRAIVIYGPMMLGIYAHGFPDSWADDLEATREELEAVELGLVDVGGEA